MNRRSFGVAGSEEVEVFLVAAAGEGARIREERSEPTACAPARLGRQAVQLEPLVEGQRGHYAL
jgi:hypothetical protein